MLIFPDWLKKIFPHSSLILKNLGFPWSFSDLWQRCPREERTRRAHEHTIWRRDLFAYSITSNKYVTRKTNITLREDLPQELKRRLNLKSINSSTVEIIKKQKLGARFGTREILHCHASLYWFFDCHLTHLLALNLLELVFDRFLKQLWGQAWRQANPSGTVAWVDQVLWDSTRILKKNRAVVFLVNFEKKDAPFLRELCSFFSQENPGTWLQILHEAM